MPNNLYNQLNNNNIVSQFNEFRKTIQGNPQQIVQQLLQSGRMSQADYNRLRQMAQEFQKLLPR